MKWVWPDGEELLFRAFANPDDYWNYHGHEYPFIGWEELTSWPSIDCYESMMSCNRTSRPGGLPLQIRSTTNPYGVGHNWVKSYFIDPAPYGAPIRNREGQARVTLFGSVNENKFIDTEYLKTLKSLTDANKRKAWLFGSWDITSGGMFDDLWVREKHVFPWGQGPMRFHWRCLPGDAKVIVKSALKRVFRRHYEGELIVIRTASGREIACTPNHPILTRGGWVAAEALNVSDNVVSYGLCEGESILHNDKNDDVPTSIKDIAESFMVSPSVFSIEVPISAPDFHGDARDGDVAVVWADSSLLVDN